jgi:hypothetical protein
MAALEEQRALLGDAVVDTALPLQEKLSALAAISPVEPQLKDITILFSDIIGSTVQQQRSEDIQAILDGALHRVNGYPAPRGACCAYGDGFKAVFGARFQGRQR